MRPRGWLAKARDLWPAVLFILILLALALSTALLGFSAQEAWAGGGKSRRDSERRSGAPFHWSGHVARGKTVTIRGINGGIHARLASGDDVVVDAVKSHRRSDPDEVVVEAAETEEGVTICARYPNPSGGLNECEHQETRDNDVVVEFELRVPPGVHLDLRTVNGGIEATGLESDVEATTVNGGVELSTTGVAGATTVNGSIDARVGSARWDGAAEFTTVNGRVRVMMPPDLQADVKASVVHGEIETDFPLTVKGRVGHRHLSGTIGRGGRTLRLQTVNGSIELRSRASASDSR